MAQDHFHTPVTAPKAVKDQTNQKDIPKGNISEQFEVMIRNATNTSTSGEIDFKNYFNFKWDSLLIVPPYFPIDSIDIRVEIKKINKTDLNKLYYSDSQNLIVFFRNGAIYTYDLFNKAYADFKNTHKHANNFLTPDNVKFQYTINVQYDSIRWINLEHYTFIRTGPNKE